MYFGIASTQCSINDSIAYEHKGTNTLIAFRHECVGLSACQQDTHLMSVIIRCIHIVCLIRGDC
jgi:hypothetical protein